MTSRLSAPSPDEPRTMLGGLSPAAFMRRHWQKKPLLVRQAFPGISPPVSAAGLKRLARQDDVESRLIWREDDQWQMESGPFSRFPNVRTPDWTLLVQSVDLHDDAAAALMHQFNFIPAARLDDLMISLASTGGGVGPHFDSYDVFLIQAKGRRRWRFGQQKDLTLVADLPLKILSNFQPEADVVLEPGDMLYLPPHAAHDGVALSDDCMTMSVGFRAPQASTLARGMLEAAAEQIAARSGAGTGMYAEPPLPGPDLSAHYRDPGQLATAHSALIPTGLIIAALRAASRVSFDEALANRYLGCWLTEPSRLAVFDTSENTDELCQAMLAANAAGHFQLDRRTRMLYRGSQLYINGELAPVRANQMLCQLADQRAIVVTAAQGRRLGESTLQCLGDWISSGWVHYRSV